MVMLICVTRQKTAESTSAIVDTIPVEEIVKDVVLHLYRRNGVQQLRMTILNVNVSKFSIHNRAICM